MNRARRLELAQETLQVLKQGFYYYKDDKIDVLDGINNNKKKSYTVLPSEWEKITKQKISSFSEKAKIFVKNCSTIVALQQEEQNNKIGILNFASAKNPGGGFLGGSSAQEESLARSSSLYASLSKDMTMYEFNRSNDNFLYSDYMIYSPETIFWLDDQGNFLPKTLTADIITSPAPNKGAMLKDNRKNEITELERIFKERISYIFHLCALQGVETLILGAWGCGVFRNDPEDVAEYFMSVLEESYTYAFKKNVFAIYDTSEKKENYSAFKEVIDKYRN